MTASAKTRLTDASVRSAALPPGKKVAKYWETDVSGSGVRGVRDDEPRPGTGLSDREDATAPQHILLDQSRQSEPALRSRRRNTESKPPYSRGL